jgi:hypothetical protein
MLTLAVYTVLPAGPQGLRRRFAVRETTQLSPTKPRLLDRVRPALRASHSSRRTEGAYVAWIKRYVRKYPNAGREWAWQWVFPATRIYRDLATGQRRRHHLHETVLQRAVNPTTAG